LSVAELITISLGLDAVDGPLTLNAMGMFGAVRFPLVKFAVIWIRSKGANVACWLLLMAVPLFALSEMPSFQAVVTALSL